MNRIRELRLQKGLTIDKLAELIGTTGATIQRLETGNRQLTEKWAHKISHGLGVQITELFGSILPVSEAGLPVLGEVQAGVWKEVETTDEQKYPNIPISADPRYPGTEQYALLVRGESMNKIFAPGEFVVCVRWAQIGRGPRDGDLVVVERRRDGLIEATCKRVRIQSNKLYLMPESTDPKWQNPIELELDGSFANDEIVVTGLVIGRYQQLG
jgi:repressor LexA